jgi:hypothetical protein
VTRESNLLVRPPNSHAAHGQALVMVLCALLAAKVRR